LKLLFADASIKAGEPVEALAIMKGLPEHAGAPGELAFLKGNAYLLAGNADPEDVDYLFAYTSLQGSQQLYSDALATLTKVRRMDPQAESIPYQIAVTYALMHRYPEALQACDDALRLASHPDEIHFLRGVIRIEQGSFQPAEASLSQAVGLNPRVASYFAALGVASYEEAKLAGARRQLDKALANYETYTALAPDTARAYQEEEALYRRAGQSEEAANAHTKYVSLIAEKGEAERDPSFVDQLWLARLREGLGKVALGP